MKDEYFFAVLVSISLVVFFGMFFVLAASHDEALRNQAKCVAATAKEQGYTGNPHGQEAYDLFISQCR